MPFLPVLGVLAVAALTAGCGAAPDRGAARTSTPTASPSATASAAGPPASATAPAPAPVVDEGDGELHPVPGGASSPGPDPAAAYGVAVEGGLGVDGADFAREVDRILADPRSWSSRGEGELRRVADGAAFRVVLASPDTTDRLCAPLQTNGRFSCRNGDLVVLNAARWLTGADTYAGQLPRYREYLVNHEVGHALGHGHLPCPGRGRPAPVMMQQTKSLDGCAPNPWPRP